MAIRAVVVALVCILVTHTLPLERSYWTFLTAFLLITQSFGDGIYRSLMRFILTIAGCLIGWVIYLPIANDPVSLMTISFTALFFSLYWLNTSIVGRYFATGILVVTGFGILSGGWTFHMLMARIQDTLIGAAIAILVNGLVFPEFSRINMKNAFRDLRPQLLTIYTEIKTGKNFNAINTAQRKLQKLEKEHLLLLQNYQAARYELLFRKRKQQRYKSMLIEIEIVFSYLNALADLKIAMLSKTNKTKKELAQSGEVYYQSRLETELQKLIAI